MNSSFKSNFKDSFNQLSQKLFDSLQTGEVLSLCLIAESTDFLRFNQSKIRQRTKVQNGQALLELHLNKKKINFSIPFTSVLEKDLKLALSQIEKARGLLKKLKEEPFFVELKNNESLSVSHSGKLLAHDDVVSTLFEKDLDMVGLYSSGSVLRANYNSLGQTHWFDTDSFAMDYSIYNGHKGAKGFYVGQHWDRSQFQNHLNETKKQLEILSRPVQKIKKGKYNVYLAPAAIVEMLDWFSYGLFSEKSLQLGQSALTKVKEGKKQFSPLLTFKENFKDFAFHPRFNNYGEVTPEEITLIEKGNLKNTLCDSRTAKEFGGQSNSAFEMLFSTEISPGSLKEEDILKELGTGIYIANLHYVNWSDQAFGRMTGMTRYACFWVENGEIVGPIENLRFDESIFHMFGEGLKALTSFRETHLNLSTYSYRHLGGQILPGALISDMSFVL